MLWNFIQRILFVSVLLWAMSSAPVAQVVVYPIVTVDQTFTYGTYQKAPQENIVHYAARISYIDHWNSSWMGGYRRTGISYSSGFEYRQHQFLLSKGHTVVAGANLIALRGDFLYLSSNSPLTDGSFTMFAGLWYHLLAAELTLGIQAHANVYEDVSTFGASGVLTTALSKRGWITGRVNLDQFSVDVGHGRTLLSANLSYYHLITASAGALFSAKTGTRSLYYEPDIFLLYNTFDAHQLGGGLTIFVAPWPWLSLFADVSHDRFKPVGGETYNTTYFSAGGRLVF